MNNSLQRRFSMTLAVVLVLAALAQAQKFTTLYNFTGGTDGNYPWAGVILDEAGNLYGTTVDGGDLDCGNDGCGVVYKLSTAGTETVLHTFGSGFDGEYPFTPVARDSAGNIYGTTESGTVNSYGTAFKIDTAGNETVLHNFRYGTSDGCLPEQSVVYKRGTLFGTTSGCGSSHYAGAIFKLGSAGNDILHAFSGGSSDGYLPEYGHLTMDKSGNFYGVTTWGGGSTECTYGCGVLYELSKSGTLTVLHSFAGGTSDGCYPYGSVARDKAGNFYGTTWTCGSNNLGTIWKVSKKGKETILHNFAAGSSDACRPLGGVTLDPSANLYGVSGYRGVYDGELYKLSAKGKLTLLHGFNYLDGLDPVGELWRTANGTLFGTAIGGGTYGYGTVWKYVP